MHCAFAAPVKYPDRDIKPYTMEIYFFILWFVDSVTILPYMLTYMYWDTNIVHVIILLYIFIIVK